MTSEEKTTAVDQIEDLIDKTSLSSVLNVIAGICYAKGLHISSAWQDQITARQWESASRKIEGLATSLNRTSKLF